VDKRSAVHLTAGTVRIAAPAKAVIRIYPQMSQMFTDEEKHLCSSVTSVDEISPPEFRRKLGGTMIKVAARDHPWHWIPASCRNDAATSVGTEYA
jgi:hypothetical protein